MMLLRFSLISLLFLSGCSNFFTQAPHAITASPAPAPTIVAANAPVVHVDYTKIVANPNYAFITDGNAKLFKCEIASDKQLINCAIVGKDAAGQAMQWSPNDIEFSTVNQQPIAYIVGTNNVYKCELVDYALVNCHATGFNAQDQLMNWVPFDLKIIKFNQQMYAYIATLGNIYRCNVNSQHELEQCASNGTSSTGKKQYWLPTGITFSQINNRLYAYIAATTQIFKCQISTNANLIGCNTTGTNYNKQVFTWHPNHITFSPQGPGYYAYISDHSYLYQCNVNNQGELLNCTPTGFNSQGQFSQWLANDITFSQNSQQQKTAYVVGIYSVFVCDVGAINPGGISNCSITGYNAKGKTINWNPNSVTLIK
ncbi:MAG: hypothetical protein ORN24_06115 [Burkholderiales bacterium]|nr:hypothetical protein [Burkholderiales bacterium]